MPRALPDESLFAKAEAVCRHLQPKLAPEWVASGLANVPMPAREVSAALRRAGDDAGADYWKALPSESPVYLCNYSEPEPAAPTETPIVPWNSSPTCPNGEIPTINVMGKTVSLWADEAGHSRPLPASLQAPELSSDPCADTP